MGAPQSSICRGKSDKEIAAIVGCSPRAAYQRRLSTALKKSLNTKPAAKPVENNAPTGDTAPAINNPFCIEGQGIKAYIDTDRYSGASVSPDGIKLTTREA